MTTRHFEHEHTHSDGTTHAHTHGAEHTPSG